MFGGSERQHSYLKSLMDERQHADGGTVAEVYGRTVPGGVEAVLAQVDSTSTASKLIDELMRMPRIQIASKRSANDRPVTETSSEPRPVITNVPQGIHFYDDTVYKVQESQLGRLYAKRLHTDPVGWAYAGNSPLANLSEATLMTREQAAEFGHRFGVCAICGKLLTDETSIERGIGPVCYKRISG